MAKPVPQKNIFAVSLDSANKHRAAAILFDNNQLFITHCLPIPVRELGWKNDLKKEIEDKSRNGFVIILEDRSGIFSPYADAFCFDDVHDGRTMLQHAFDWWFSLQNSGNLILDESLRRFALTENENSLVDIKNDDKGRRLYVPKWGEFHGAHKAMLLCVLGAMMEPNSKHWFDAFMAAMPELPPPEWNIWERWAKAMKNMENDVQENFERMRQEKEASKKPVI